MAIDPKLRERAQAVLRSGHVAGTAGEQEDRLALIEELHTHQIELETQNEELRASQLQLQSARDSYADLYEWAPVAYLTLADDETIQQANQAAVQLFGRRRSELIGARVTQFIHDDDQDVWNLHRMQLLDRLLRRVCELRVNVPQGVRIIQIAAHLVRAPNGAGSKLLVSMTDVTERRDEERLMRTREQQYRSVVDASGEAIIGLTRDDIVATWNQAAQRMFGYSADEVKGEGLSRIVPPERRVEHSTLYSQVRSGQTVAEFETQMLTKDGRLLDVMLTLQRILDDAGNVIGIAATIRDVTAYNRSQQQLRQREAELMYVSRASSMGEVVLTLTHELNQPLATAATYAGRCIDLLKTKTLHPNDLLEPLGLAYAQIMHAGNIISRLKSFVAKSKPYFESIDLNDLVRMAEQLMPRILSSARVTRRLALHPHSIEVMADALQIEQVLVNLMSNAFQAIGEEGVAEGEILLRTSVTENGGEVSVIDSGSGIATEHLDRIFDPYFSSKPDGMGMGLSICRTIISNHNGRIWATNNQDRGACFSFTLPLAGNFGAAHQQVTVAAVCETTSRTS